MKLRSIRHFFALALCSTFLAASPALAANWLPFGPDGGDARRIVPDPSNHAHLYLGTANGWIYESRDTGATWRRLARVDKRDELVLDSIVVDAKDPRHLIVGAWVINANDGGLFISYDAGKTWTNQAEMRGQSVRSLRSSPTDPKELVAGTLKGVFRSTDGGRRWAQISPPDSTEIHEVQSVAIDPADPNIIYAGTWHLPWKTTDGGEHWENMKDGIIDDSDVFSIIVDPLNPKTVYASACSGIYKSEDAGTLFHKVQGIPSSARRTRVLLQDPNDLKTVFAGTTEGLFRSSDAGKTWTRTTGPEIIVNDVSIDQTDSKHVLIATNRGGVLSSDDGGDTFHSSNSGFSARQIIAMHHDLEHPETVLVGIVNDKEWGGVFRSSDGGVSWLQRSEGLQGRDVFALGQAPDGTYIAGTAHGIFRLDRTSDTWVKVQAAPTGIPQPEAAHAAPIAVRAPVPVERNRYAERKSTGHTLQAKGSAHHAKRGVVAQRKPLAQASSHSARSKPVLKPKPHQELAVRHASAPLPPSGGAPPAENAAAALPVEPASASGGFDGSVVGLATTGDTVLAITSAGLMSSLDNGVTWTLSGPERSADWRFLASSKNNVVSASLHSMSFSADTGKTWSAVLLPEGLTQVGAIAVEPSGTIWVGGREGVFVSKDAGGSWTTPKNLFVHSVNSFYLDEAASRMMVTSEGYSSLVFLVQLPSMQVTFADSGWPLRFARPVGDHLIAATLFDGVVVQPKMVNSPMQSPRASVSEPPAASAQQAAPPPQPPAVVTGVPTVTPVTLGSGQPPSR